MTRSQVLKYVFVSLPLFLAFSCPGPNGHRYSGERVVLPKGEVHEGWYFAAGNQVVIDGTVNGDAYVAGGLVDVDGTINGQLVVAGGQVNVSGTVTDRIYGAAGSLRLNGHTGKSVVAAGGSVMIGRDATIGENLLAAGGSLQIDGTVQKASRVAAGDVQIGGVVNGDLDASADRLHIYEGARVGGNLDVFTKDSTRVSVAPGTVTGTVSISAARPKEMTRILGLRVEEFWLRIVYIVTLLVTTLLFALVLPQQLASLGSSIIERPGASALWGLGTFVITPVVFIILLITVIGIPVGLFVAVCYFWLMYLSQLGLGAALAHRLSSLQGRSSWSLFCSVAGGILIVQVCAFVPYLHGLIILAGVIFGMGALAMITRDSLVRLRSPRTA